VEEIVAEAGVSMGALYYHFPAKEELYQSLLREHVGETLHILHELPPPSSLHEAIRNLMAFWLDHLRGAAGSQPLMIEFWAQASRQEWAQAEVEASLRRFRDVIAAMLLGGQEAGAVRRHLDTTAAAFLIVAVLQGVSLQHVIGRGDSDLASIEEPLVDIIERFITNDAEKSDPIGGDDHEDERH
jgi:AcrR family transcriptional regulator